MSMMHFQFCNYKQKLTGDMMKTKAKLLWFQTQANRGGPREEIAPPKTCESNFIHHDFV